MLFKFSKPQLEGDAWVLMDGFDEITWQDGWLIMLPDADTSESSHMFGITFRDPNLTVANEPRSISCLHELYLPSNSFKLLTDKKVDAVPVVVINLIKNETVERRLAVMYGFILNETGRTVEKLHARAG